MVFSLSPAAYLNAFELPRLWTKNTIYQWTGSRMLEQKFIQSLGYALWISLFAKNTVLTLRDHKLLNVSLKQSVLVYPRGSNSVGFFRETCKLQSMYLSANYSWWLLEACFLNTTVDCIGRTRKTQHLEINNQKWHVKTMWKRYRNIIYYLTMGQLQKHQMKALTASQVF